MNRPAMDARTEPPVAPAELPILVAAKPTTQGQRVALLAGLGVAVCVALYLFSSILLPFVAAACLAYFLDPPTTRLTRLGMPRGLAAGIMIIALLAAMLLFALLLYPLLLAQIGLLISRAPSYVMDIRDWAGDVVHRMQERLGSEYVDEKLRDLVAGQAGAMLGWVAGTLTRIVGSGFALFSVISLAVVTPVVAFYLLRDWRRAVAQLDSWLPRRYAGVLRAQAREVDRILSAWLRGQAICCLLLAAFYAVGLTLVGPRPGADRRHGRRAAELHPVCRQRHGRPDQHRAGPGAVPLAGGGRGRRRVRRRPTARGLRDLPSLSGRPRRAACGLGHLRAVRRRRGVRVPGRAAGRAGRGRTRRAGPVLAAPLPRQPNLPRAAALWLEAQLPLAFPHRPALGEADFLPHDGVRLALDTLAAGHAWPAHRLVLWGGQGAGKTHLLHIWARENGAAVVAGPDLVAPFWPESPVAIDDSDQVPSEPALLHVLNAAAEGRHRLLLTSTRPPARSPVALPDLASRLRASMAIEIGPRDDDGLAALLAKLLSERQLAVPPPLQRWLLTRLPRTAGSLRDAVARLDYAALAAKTGVSRQLAAEALSDLFLDEPAQESTQ